MTIGPRWPSTSHVWPSGSSYEPNAPGASPVPAGSYTDAKSRLVPTNGLSLAAEEPAHCMTAEAANTTSA
jgi:hypothetical protein